MFRSRHACLHGCSVLAVCNVAHADGIAVSQTSPISIGVPAGDEADLVLDMGASFGLGLELFESVPSLQGAFFKNLAVGTAGTIVP